MEVQHADTASESQQQNGVKEREGNGASKEDRRRSQRTAVTAAADGR